MTNKIQSLIESGILQFALQPAANPQDLSSGNYTIPLIEHDYPAKTPVMWNEAYKAFGMPTRNIMLVGDPDKLPEIFSAFRSDPDYLGGGAGVGFKDSSIPHLDEIEPMAAEIGAVNFILKTDGNKLKGFNTDGAGYAESLSDLLESRGQTLAGKKVVVLGAGGTSNSIVFALAEKGAQLVILNRTVQTAELLAEKVNNFFSRQPADLVRFGGEEAIAEETADADVVLNVSTKGSAGALEQYSALAPAKLPATPENVALNHKLSQDILRRLFRNVIISDIILAKEPTPFMRSAAEAGLTTLDGIGMVVNQGVEAFWILHGKELAEKGVSKSQVKEIMKQAAK